MKVKKVLILAMSAYTFGGAAGGIQQMNSIQTGKNFHCKIENCNQIGVHQHSTCQVENCTNKGEHLHDGRFYLGHHANDGHGHQRKAAMQKTAAVNLNQTKANTCGINGCTIIGQHEHKVCEVAGCTNTAQHQHNGTIYHGHHQADGHGNHTCGVPNCPQTEAHSHQQQHIAYNETQQQAQQPQAQQAQQEQPVQAQQTAPQQATQQSAVSAQHGRQYHNQRVNPSGQQHNYGGHRAGGGHH